MKSQDQKNARSQQKASGSGMNFLEDRRRGRCFIVNNSWWWLMKFSFICCLRPRSWIFPDFFPLLSWSWTLSLEILIILPCALSAWINYYFIYSQFYKRYFKTWTIRNLTAPSLVAASNTWQCPCCPPFLPLTHRPSYDQTAGVIARQGWSKPCVSEKVVTPRHEALAFQTHLSKGAAPQCNLVITHSSAIANQSVAWAHLLTFHLSGMIILNTVKSLIKKGSHLIQPCDCTKQDSGLHRLFCLSHQQSHWAPSGHAWSNVTSICPVHFLLLYPREKRCYDFLPPAPCWPI